ncbi:hypothetical protein P0F65_16040 [Sphingomonas sp. I4]
MADRYPVTWLMTDERLGDGLWRALARLPPGSGVVFRHHATPRRRGGRSIAGYGGSPRRGGWSCWSRGRPARRRRARAWPDDGCAKLARA